MTDESDEKVKMALRLQALEHEIEAINEKLARSDGRWSAVYDIAKKTGMVAALFLLSFWARAKDLI